MPREMTNVALSDDLEPLLQRTKDFAQAAAIRAMESAVSATPGGFDAGSIEEVIDDFLRTRTGAQAGASVDPIFRRGITARLAPAARFFNTMRTDAIRGGPLARLDFAAKKGSLAAQLQKNNDTLFGDDIKALKAGRPSPILDGLALAFRDMKNAGAAAQPSSKISFINRRFQTVRAVQESVTTVAAPAAAAPAPPRWNALELEITKVKCLDPVDEWGIDWGVDKINMGGEANDTTGKQIQVNQFHVSNFSQSNKVHSWSGNGRTFAKFNLAQGAWTQEGRAFWAWITLAEKDADGGFLDFLQKLWDAIGKAVVSSLTDAILAAAASAGVGAAVGIVLTGPETAGVGAIVGAIVGAVAGFIVGLIIEALKDDVFEPIMTTPLWLPSQQGTFENGSKESPIFSAKVYRDNAVYKIWYRWILS